LIFTIVISPQGHKFTSFFTLLTSCACILAVDLLLHKGVSNTLKINNES